MPWVQHLGMLSTVSISQQGDLHMWAEIDEVMFYGGHTPDCQELPNT